MTPKRIALTAGLILALIYIAFGTDVTLEWQPSPAPGIANYAVYAQKVGATNIIRVNAGTNLTATVSNLTSGTWQFWATASIEITESDPSNTATNRIPPPPSLLKVIP